MNQEKLKFPIGEYHPVKEPNDDLLCKWIFDIESFPNQVEELTKNLTVEELNWQYRPNGWAIKQVVHHCTDSHINSIIRFKLALTENEPTIRPYLEAEWAELADSKSDDITHSLLLLKGLHYKWVLLLRSLTSQQLKREFIHPEHGRRFSIAENIGLYAWHCNHHLAHIKNAIEGKGRNN